MPSSPTDLSRQLLDILKSSNAKAIALAIYDYETELAFSSHGDEWFHAASTIKVPLLVAVFDAIRQGRFTLESRLHVRNRFLSVADGSTYRLSTSRDANSAVHKAIGKTMNVEDLAFHMITTSSNLATNLLLDLVGLEEAQKSLESMGLQGIKLKRGVEDNVAYDQGIHNEVTASGLLELFKMIEEKRAVSPEASEKMLEILHAQEFKSGIPAGLPNEARIAHKTGEISTVAHDAGVVYLPDRKPYLITILTRWDADQGGRHDAVASISRAVYKMLTSQTINISTSEA